ncbi:MAG: hypothetical protein MUF00_19670 [Gemmatimonadaceae bacterium]|nr:hypothetical protein [Gemmatimonadaceae bacterium]
MAVRLIAAVAIVASIDVASATAQSRADTPMQLVITYRDGRRVNIPLSEIERFEVGGERRAEVVAAASTAAATPGTAPASAPPAMELTGLAASIPGTWMHRSHAVFDIQRFLPSGAVTTRTGTRGTWTVEGQVLVVKWPNGVVHKYGIEAGATLLEGSAIPVEKKEKPEPISLERMRG